MFPTRRQPAFSLLELVIVLVVMIGLLAIVWPNLQRPLSRTTLSEAAQVLREVIDETRYQATVQGVPQFVHLSQGEGEFQSGTFEAFLAASDEGLKASAVTARQPNSATDSSRSAVASVKHWKLPPAVIVADVSWSLDNRARDPLSRTVEKVQSANVSAEVSAGLSADGPGATGVDWWLPFLATGQGRDARIELHDHSIQQSLIVTYEAATGALEISR